MLPGFRLFFFFSGLIFFSGLEFLFSYRKRQLSRASRWPHNFLIIFLSSLVVKAILPLGLFVICSFAKKREIGLLNIIDIDFSFKLLISIISLDFFIYLQHWYFHRNKYLWKLHRVHHSDIDLDASSALRFHPLEILISLFFKAVLILIFGFPYEAIFLFEIILNFMAMFNHSNIALGKKMEQFLRKIFVTPQMHIIHHSIEQFESDTNFGFNFSFWDRLFKTYSSEFKSNGIIGNKRFRSAREHGLLEILKQPFL